MWERVAACRVAWATSVILMLISVQYYQSPERAHPARHAACIPHWCNFDVTVLKEWLKKCTNRQRHSIMAGTGLNWKYTQNNKKLLNWATKFWVVPLAKASFLVLFSSSHIRIFCNTACKKTNTFPFRPPAYQSCMNLNNPGYTYISERLTLPSPLWTGACALHLIPE